MIEYGCKYYVGDEDCCKCIKYGLISTCTGCDGEDEKESEEQKDEFKS